MTESPALLGPDVTIAHAAAWRETLADAVNAGGDLPLDLGSITEFDSAGVQLLLATQRSLQSDGRVLRIVAMSPAVRDALEVFGLGTTLALAD